VEGEHGEAVMRLLAGIVHGQLAQSRGIALQARSVLPFFRQNVQLGEQAVGAAEPIDPRDAGYKPDVCLAVDGTAQLFGNDEVAVRCECAHLAQNGKTRPQSGIASRYVVCIPIACFIRCIKMPR
jgi:hypothetical protein